MLHGLAASIQTRLPQVEFDPGSWFGDAKDKVPSPEGVVDKGNDLSDWVASRGSAFWMIFILVIVTTLIYSALKKDKVKGFFLGALALAILIIIVS